MAWGLEAENMPLTDYTIGIDTIDNMVKKLQEMPWTEYYAIATKAQQKLAADSGPGGGGLRRGYNPVVDGTVGGGGHSRLW